MKNKYTPIFIIIIVFRFLWVFLLANVLTVQTQKGKEDLSIKTRWSKCQEKMTPQQCDVTFGSATEAPFQTNMEQSRRRYLC